jgi:hypothetical protein
MRRKSTVKIIWGSRSMLVMLSVVAWMRTDGEWQIIFELDLWLSSPLEICVPPGHLWYIL